ncbi:lipid II:glycine glycyltransferase FemX [Nanoarchaeota archaeon]
MKIQKLNKENKKLLRAFLEKNKETKIQHSLEWLKSIESSYKNCKSYYYLAFEKNKIKAVLPFLLVQSKFFGNRLISMPFIDNGGFIGKIDGKIIEDILEEIKKELKDLKFVQVRINSHMKNYKTTEKALIGAKFEKELDRSQFILELKDSEKMWSKLSRSTRRMVRKAKEKGLYVKELSPDEKLDSFYKIYFKNMKYFGTPPHSKVFFKNLWKNLYPKHLKGFNCYYQGKHIATMICYLYDNYVYYIYSVSNPEYLKLNPNEFLYWNFLKWSAENKYKWFDFGQAEINAEEGSHAQGIYNFKKKWNGEIYERPYFTYYFEKQPNEKQGKSKLKKYVKIWKRLPNSSIKIVGPKICRELGL